MTVKRTPFARTQVSYLICAVPSDFPPHPKHCNFRQFVVVYDYPNYFYCDYLTKASLDRSLLSHCAHLPISSHQTQRLNQQLIADLLPHFQFQSQCSRLAYSTSSWE